MSTTSTDASSVLGTKLADLVTARPSSAAVLGYFGIDYCCGGQRTLEEATQADGLNADAILAALSALEAVPEAPADQEDWATMAPAELVDHLESVHHAYLHAELPRLDALAEKVATVHGERHPELVAVRADVRALVEDLDPHLAKEERVLFPLIRELAAAVDAGETPPAPLTAPIQVMRTEHDHTGELLSKLRADALDFALPGDACGSYQALYQGLAQLEADTHLHVHKENNVLFPAVEALGA